MSPAYQRTARSLSRARAHARTHSPSMFVRLKSEGEERAAIFSASLPKTREKDSRRITIRTILRSPGIGFFQPRDASEPLLYEVKPIKRDTFHGLCPIFAVSGEAS